MTNTNSRSRRRLLAPITAVVISLGLVGAACGSTQSGAGDHVEAAGVATVAAVTTVSPAAAVTTASAVTTAAAATTASADYAAHGGHNTPELKHSRTASENALYKGMQTLWQQHMEWTYATIASFAVGSPGYQATVERLLANQDDIGNAIKPFYGDAAGDALTVLLKDHIAGVAAILTAAKAGDSAAQAKAVAAEYANAKAIGDLLATANPTNWSKSSMEKMMETHIDQTLVYATDMLTGNYGAAISHYGQAEAHMVEMADMLSAGVIAQFPNDFRK